MRKLGVIAVMLLGLWALLQVIPSVAYSLSAFTLQDGLSVSQKAFVALIALLPAAAYAAAGLLLLLRRQSLVDRLVQDDDIELAIDPPSVLRLGLLIVGLVFSLKAVSAALRAPITPIWIALQDRAFFGALAGSSADLWSTALSGVVAPVIELALGLLLIFSSGRLAARLWNGRPPRVEAEPGLPDEPSASGIQTCQSCGTPFDPEDYIGGLMPPRCPECREPLAIDRTEQARQPDAPEVRA